MSTRRHSAEERAVSRLWVNRAKHLNLRARVHDAGHLYPADLREIVKRDGSTCVYCNKPLDYLTPGLRATNDSATFDHIIRLVDGGSHSYENLVCACRTCNQRNAEKSLADPLDAAMERLRRYLARRAA